MIKQNIRYLAILAAIPAVGIVACSGKKQAEVAQTVAKAEHNPAQCPKLDMIKGDFVMQESKDMIPKQVNIQDNADLRLLIVTFDGKEQVVVNGEKQQQDNGANLTAACINDKIHVVGTGPEPDKNFVDFNLKASDDAKQLIVDRIRPDKMTFHYERTTNPFSIISDRTKQLLDKLTGNKSKKSGLPTTEDKKATPR